VGLPKTCSLTPSEKLLMAWRARAGMQYPSDLEAIAAPLRRTLLATLYWVPAGDHGRPG
jgi:hypothetical protein